MQQILLKFNFLGLAACASLAAQSAIDLSSLPPPTAMAYFIGGAPWAPPPVETVAATMASPSTLDLTKLNRQLESEAARGAQLERDIANLSTSLNEESPAKMREQIDERQAFAEEARRLSRLAYKLQTPGAEFFNLAADFALHQTGLLKEKLAVAPMDTATVRQNLEDKKRQLGMSNAVQRALAAMVASERANRRIQGETSALDAVHRGMLNSPSQGVVVHQSMPSIRGMVLQESRHPTIEPGGTRYPIVIDPRR